MFQNMKIGMRLGLGFGIVVMLMAGIAFLAISRMASLNQSIDLLINDRYPKTVWANNVIDNINIIARSMRNALLIQDAAGTRQEIARI
jgi:methyl-accepting chemotaxis protein